jgi:hypothetical protein
VLQVLVDALRPGIIELELDEIVRKEFEAQRDPDVPRATSTTRRRCAFRSTTRSCTASPASGRSRTAISSLGLGARTGVRGRLRRDGGRGHDDGGKQRLIDSGREAMWRGIGARGAGGRVSDIGHAIQTYGRARATASSASTLGTAWPADARRPADRTTGRRGRAPCCAPAW